MREVIDRAEPSSTPRGILWLWAAITVVGFPLVDFAPNQVGWFWLVAAPVGLVVSLWLGAREARAQGQESRQEARRHFLHWGGLLGVLALVPVLAWQGVVRGDGIGVVFLLVLSLAYWLAGVHLVPRMMPIGVLAAALTIVLSVWDLPYAWSLAGGVLALGLVVSGHQEHTPREAS